VQPSNDLKSSAELIRRLSSLLKSTKIKGGTIREASINRKVPKHVCGQSVRPTWGPGGNSTQILGVLDGFTGPRQSTIIARLSGANVARTGVFAGMSGSPVFIDNKLVGAIAYSFPFAKEPICGITPIKQMIDIFERVKEKPRTGEARVVSFSSLASTEWKSSLPRQPVSATTLIAPNRGECKICKEG